MVHVKSKRICRECGYDRPGICRECGYDSPGTCDVVHYVSCKSQSGGYGHWHPKGTLHVWNERLGKRRVFGGFEAGIQEGGMSDRWDGMRWLFSVGRTLVLTDKRHVELVEAGEKCRVKDKAGDEFDVEYDQVDLVRLPRGEW